MEFSIEEFEKIAGLTSVKCLGAIWEYPLVCPRHEEAFKRFTTWDERDSWKRWEAWDEKIIELFTAMRSSEENFKEHPLLEPTINRNLARFRAWTEFCKNVTSPSPEALRALADEIEAIVPVVVAPDWPPMAGDMYWLVENVVLGHLSRYQAELSELSDVSIAIGRTITQLAGLINIGLLRRNQAKKVLERCLLVEHIGVPLEDLIWRDEFTSLIDEAPVDDSLGLLIDAVLLEEAKAVEQVKAGKEKALGSIMGKILKQVKADPKAIKELVMQKINGV
jgi:hypothetical protein